MSKTTITQLPDPLGFSADPLTDVIRDGARKLIEQAIHAELAALMSTFSENLSEKGLSDRRRSDSPLFLARDDGGSNGMDSDHPR